MFNDYTNVIFVEGLSRKLPFIAMYQFLPVTELIPQEQTESDIEFEHSLHDFVQEPS